MASLLFLTISSILNYISILSPKLIHRIHPLLLFTVNRILKVLSVCIFLSLMKLLEPTLNFLLHIFIPNLNALFHQSLLLRKCRLQDLQQQGHVFEYLKMGLQTIFEKPYQKPQQTLTINCSFRRNLQWHISFDLSRYKLLTNLSPHALDRLYSIIPLMY